MHMCSWVSSFQEICWSFTELIFPKASHSLTLLTSILVILLFSPMIIHCPRQQQTNLLAYKCLSQMPPEQLPHHCKCCEIGQEKPSGHLPWNQHIGQNTQTQFFANEVHSATLGTSTYTGNVVVIFKATTGLGRGMGPVQVKYHKTLFLLRLILLFLAMDFYGCYKILLSFQCSKKVDCNSFCQFI